ncbi:MAG: Eco57I restriction-modification methylase domain-containing protein [Bacteroidales bacterium]|nr:Eco57I restriction-modification methylase domain-containing protein [Bacteroidales bacterium]
MSKLASKKVVFRGALKNDLGDFLKNTFYQPDHYINTKDRADLVIHNGKDPKSAPGVLIEVKKPGNKSEMIRPDNLKAKAFYELILYYLRERIINGNLEIKHLVVTNVYEWFIFDAAIFEKTFAQSKILVKQFTDFEEGRLAGTTTDFFYSSIAQPFVSGIETDISFTWFDFRDYEKPLRNNDKTDDARLIALFKVLSPEHLLKLPFLNDSNTLDKTFYSELLHIIGLTETKSGSKKIIERKKEGQRDPGSLIENTILQLDTRDKISRLPKPALFGETYAERLFTVALELVITWLNRILFLKLLEAQLIRYHKGDPEYGFMNTGLIDGYDDLDNLFFRALARKAEDRDAETVKLFSKIPYLNSSLFEPTELEQLTIFISNLQDHALLPVIGATVLKDNTGKKRAGKMNGLQYLFGFLDAYDFAGEGSEEIQEDNKTLINASVLGLIFEKINGYKDGSFFTPGFITMYMCRETIRRAVVQKFNDARGWNCETIDQLYDKIEDRQEANRIINSLKICDPAVGSGHFLVSALNEIIAIKSDLKILTDREGRRLKEYRVEVANDELVVTDEEGDLFEYIPGNNESQRIQEALFHEKQTIIENCLFGVDINPNSVKICRLRLWIELLKSAYYLTPQPPLPRENWEPELETLPNIDINIKCGYSLISRYSLDADIKQALKKSKWSIDSYRLAVMSYRNADNKEEKRTMERLIESIKSDFETEVAANDKRLLQLKKLNGDLYNLTQQTSLFERNKKELADWNKQVNDLTGKIKKLETELEEIKSNKIYENAFEWRFEFPEVLNDDGDFVGFDVVIGNPPYITGSSFKEFQQYFLQRFKTAEYQLDLYPLFIELADFILKKEGSVSLITPNSWLKNLRMQKTREFILSRFSINSINANISNAFEEAQVDTLIFFFSKTNQQTDITIWSFVKNSYFFKHYIDKNSFSQNERYVFDVEVDPTKRIILQKVREQSQNLENNFEITRGVNPYDKYRGQSEEIITAKAYHANHKKDETFLPELRGKHIGMFSY